MHRKLSAIIPLYNEEQNVKPMYVELKEALEELVNIKKIKSYEIIFINDDSKDSTQKNLEDMKKTESSVKIIQFRRNFGQTAALKAGFDCSTGDLIVTMDGDMQNDPKDIKKLIEKLDEGYDVVSGWRFNRKDKFGKKIASRMMNNLRQIIIGDYLHDYGCSLKIYKKECIKDLELFGELHRYITAYLYIKGYKIGEAKVNHRPRKRGKTKYKFNRGLNGIFDLFFLKFWASYSHQPLHFFGRAGAYQLIFAFFILLEQIIKAYFVGELTFGPLLAFSALLVTTGMLTIIFGFIFEMLSRLYFKDKNIYSVSKIFGLANFLNNFFFVALLFQIVNSYYNNIFIFGKLIFLGNILNN